MRDLGLDERDDGRPSEPAILGGPHVNHLAVGSGIEGDAVLAGQGAVEIDRQAVETAKGRHGAQFAIGEEPPEFMFGSHASLGQPPDRIVRLPGPECDAILLRDFPSGGLEDRAPIGLR